MTTTFGLDDEGKTTLRIAGSLMDVKAEMARIAAECIAKNMRVRFLGPFQWHNAYVTHGEIEGPREETKRRLNVD